MYSLPIVTLFKLRAVFASCSEEPALLHAQFRAQSFNSQRTLSSWRHLSLLLNPPPLPTAPEAAPLRKVDAKHGPQQDLEKPLRLM